MKVLIKIGFYLREGSIQEWGLIQYDIWTKLEIFGQSAIHTVERSFQLSRPSSTPNFLMMKRLVTLLHLSENDQSNRPKL